MHKGKDLDCKSVICYDETFKYLEIFFFWNRISLDLNYSLLAGTSLTLIKPGFHKANFDHDNDPFRVKTKQLVGGMTAQPLIALFLVSWSWSLL